MPVQSGLTASSRPRGRRRRHRVALRSGDVPVLATPRVVALCEEACRRGRRGATSPRSQTTVGMRVQLDHLAPDRRRAAGDAPRPTLEKIEGRRLTFTVSVSDARGLVAAGKVTRVVVDGTASSKRGPLTTF